MKIHGTEHVDLSLLLCSQESLVRRIREVLGLDHGSGTG
jgi:hypothetical protein